MNQNLKRLFLGFGCLLLVGCGDNHDQVAKDSITAMKKFVSIMESIETVDDAKAAKSKLESIARDMRTIEARAKKLGNPGEEAEKKLKEKYQSDKSEVDIKIAGFKTMDPAILKELESTINEVTDAK